MGFNTPKAVARIGTYSQLTKSRVEDAHDAQWHRATARYQVAQYAAALRAEGRSLRATTKLVLTGIKTNLFLMDRAPSHETIRKLSDAWNAGRTSIGDYFDEPRTGRPAVTSTKLVDIIKLAVRVQDYASISSLHVRVTTEAARLGVSVPSYDTVKKLVANQGRVARSAAAHGAKAAQLDAMPHSTVPVVRPHDAWVLDEFDAPFYAKIYDSDVEEWVSVRPSIITIADHFSGAIVGHWVADPARRRDAETRRIMRAGFDVKDVLGALLSAAWGQALACPGTANFTGFLPQALRWDNHKTHGSLRPILTELGKRLVLEIGSFYAEHQDAPTTSWSHWEEVPVHEVAPDATVGSTEDLIVPLLPRHRPINRGKIERAIGTAKKLCYEFPSHVDRVVPLDRLTDDLKRLRDISVGAGARLPRREPIDVRRLPSIEDCRAMFDGRMHFYNLIAVPKRVGMTRAATYSRGHDARTARKGSDLLAALETKTTYVKGEGIEHHHDGQSTLFAYGVDRKFVLALDTEVTYKADPLLRGIFASIEKKFYLLPPKMVWAAEPGRAEEQARTQAEWGRFGGAEAIAARDAMTDAQYGPGAAHADRIRADAAIKLARELARQSAKSVPPQAASNQEGTTERPAHASAGPRLMTTDAAPATEPSIPTLLRPMVFKSRLAHLKELDIREGDGTSG